MATHASARPRKKRAAHEEEHENHERWLVTYADMITLLMVLFIVLFAISQVDQHKFKALKDGLAQGFGAPVIVNDGGQSAINADAIAPGAFEIGAAAAQPKDPEQGQSRTSAEVTQYKNAQADAQRQRVQQEVKNLEKVRKDLQAALAKAGLKDTAEYRYDERGLVVSVITDEVVFAADRAELSPLGAKVLAVVSPVLTKLPNDIAVDGHTNLVPVKPKYFPTEWELSSARAVTVVRTLIADGVAPHRLSATGYADQRPLVPGTGPVANRVNRRVEITVLSTLPPADRALLPKIAPTSAAG